MRKGELGEWEGVSDEERKEYTIQRRGRIEWNNPGQAP